MLTQDKAGWAYPGGAQILFVIESCRRLIGEELAAYQAARARAAYGKRHMLPCMQSLRHAFRSVLHLSDPVVGHIEVAPPCGFFCRPR